MSTELCDLVLETCDLLERARTAPDRPTAGADLLARAELLRAELCGALAACDDAAVAADGHAAVCALDGLVSRLGADVPPRLALSA